MTAVQAATGPQAKARPAGSRWLLADDGIIDDLAVSIAAAGSRPVALTPAERRLAAKRILTRGGNAGQIAARLHMSHTAARALAAQIRQAAEPDKAGDAA
jgi:hypothetical protein